MAVDESRVRAQIKGLLERWRYNAPERERVRRLRDMAAGDAYKYVPPLPGEEPWHADAKPRYAPNLLGWILERISRLYDHNPIREVEGASNDLQAQRPRPRTPDQAFFEDKVWTWNEGINSAYAESERLKRLTGTCLLQYVYRRSPTIGTDLRAEFLGQLHPGSPSLSTNTSEDGVEVIVHARDEFEVLENEWDTRHAEAVLVYLGRRHVPGRFAFEPNIERHFAYWDRVCMARLVETTGVTMDFSRVEPIEHGYGALPFVVARNQKTFKQFCAYNDGGVDLEATIIAILSQWRELNWTILLQRGQPVITGEKDPQNLVLAPDAPLILQNTGAMFKIEGGQANITGMIAVLQMNLDVLAQAMHLPTGTFRAELASNTSGVAIAMQESRLKEDRAKRAELARGEERQGNRMAARVYNYHRGTSYLGRADVTFPEPAPLLSQADKLALANSEWEKGLIAGADYIATMRPELSPTQVTDRLARALKYHAGTRLAQEGDETPPAESSPADEDSPPRSRFNRRDTDAGTTDGPTR